MTAVVKAVDTSSLKDFFLKPDILILLRRSLYTL